MSILKKLRSSINHALETKHIKYADVMVDAIKEIGILHAAFEHDFQQGPMGNLKCDLCTFTKEHEIHEH